MKKDNPIEDIYPLSPMQQGMLFHSLYSGKSEAYFEQLSFTIQGRLDVAVWRQSWESLVQRHPALRTAFLWGSREEPLQIVFRRGKVNWQEEDWRQLTTAEQEERLASLLRNERATGFNLARLPLMRFSMIRLAEQSHRFIWNYHHLLLDGWSVSLLLTEVFALYEVSCRGERADLGRPAPYGEYISWLKRQNLQEAKVFWSEKLDGFVSPTTLRISPPTNKLDAHEESYRTQYLSLDTETTVALQALVRRHQLTFNTLVQGALAYLLSVYSGERDVVFGATVSGRPAGLPGAQSMVGLFINTIPVRAQVAEKEPAVSWLRKLQLSYGESQAFEFTSLVDIQGWSKVPRGTPLFDCLLVFENYPAATRAGKVDSALRIQDVRANDWSDYGLTLSAWLSPELTLRLAYHGDRFDDDSIKRVLEHYCRILATILSDSLQSLGLPNLLTDLERRQLLCDWNGPVSVFPSDSNIASSFEQQVARTPQAIALVAGDSFLTYSFLNSRANQLAHYLRSLGVGPDTCVGLALSRSPQLIIALLAIVKAGGAYVPLDSSYPLERVSLMIDDAQLPLIVTEQELFELLPSYWGQVICVDSDRDLFEGYGTDNPVTELSSQNLAYVTYTSGSTGRPKGVKVCHLAVLRLVLGVSYVQLDESNSVLHHSPLPFDASTFEIWGALLCGGRVVLLSWTGNVPTPEQLGQIVREQNVRTAWLTASLFNAVVEWEPKALEPIEQLLVGGEALSEWHVRQALERLPATQLINGYGPTEATTFTCAWRVPAGYGESDERIKIGRAIENTRTFVASEAMELMPPGVVGELWIGGEGLARGYLGHPELTAERFMPDSWSGGSGERVYRSGDLARYTAQGELEYLGRADSQVKVRGYRIELGEIEAVLLEQGEVAAAVALVREDDGAEKQLVAYVVLKNDAAAASSKDLTSYLRERLPEYMVPAVIVQIESLPLNANGKVDRQALPRPDLDQLSGEKSYVAPRTKTENTLAETWAESLNLERVGIRDSFFDLGGDSIRSIQVAAKSRGRGVVFSIQDLFAHPTIEELARVIAQTDELDFEPIAPFALIGSADRERLPEGVEDCYPLTKLQAGMVFHTELSPQTAIYHDIFSLHLRASFDARYLRDALGDLVQRHPLLRTSFSMIGFNEPLQLVHKSIELRWHVHDLTLMGLDEQQRVLEEAFEAEKARSFDWEQAPLWRVAIYSRSSETFQLIFSLHHAIMDGWSVATFLTEWFQHYWYLLGKTRKDIGPPPQAAFRDFVVLEQQARTSAETRAFWEQQLSGYQPFKLPRRGGMENAQLRSESPEHIALFGPELAAGTNRLASQLGVPVKNLLLAVHLRMLSWLSGRTDIATGLVTHGRPEQSDGDRVLGLFLNVLPFRQNLGGGSWANLVNHTFQLEQDVFPHRRYPFAEIQQMYGSQSLLETAFGFLHFHVYQAFENLGEQIQVLEGRTVTETNFTFIAAFSIDPLTSQMRLALMYDAQQLTPAWIEATSAHYLQTLASMVANPHERYELQSPLSQAERLRMLIEWNDTGSRLPDYLSLDLLCAGPLDRAPHAIALQSDDLQLSYLCLHQRANQLAHLLISLGLSGGQVVALALPRSPQLVISILATIKAGAVYLPLDPTYPPQRQLFMLAAAEATLVITESETVPPLAVEGRPVVDLNRDRQLIVSQPTIDPLAAGKMAAVPDQVAYINFTSGSTGTPKGIAVPHRAVANLLCNTNFIQLSASDHVAQASNASFDALTFELWGALLNGARLNLVDTDTVLSPAQYARQIAREQIDVIFMTTALLNQMARETPWAFENVSVLLFGGQAVEPRWVRTVLGQGYSGRLLHVYGPTEATTFSTYHEVTGVDAEATTVPIGKVLSNAKAYVLDRHQQLVAVGVEGELYLGGKGLAHGYVGQAALTAERFVPHPFSGTGGERLYRTGDLVRFTDGGAIEYVGRVDEQVKIRGFRVEPGEVAAVLRQEARVAETVVVAKEDSIGEKQLIAYVIEREGSRVTNAELKSYLQERLPEYMVPAAIVKLERMPLTANGKVDLAALPAPGEDKGFEIELGQARTAEEELVAGIFARLLHLDAVTLDESFFDMGGHSLLATQVVNRMRDIFQVEVPLRVVFERPTVREIGLYLKEARNGGGKLAAGILAANSSGEVPLSFAQQRLWFLDRFEPESSFYNIPAALRLNGPLQIGALLESLSEIQRRHEILRTTFPREDGQPVQVVSAPRPLTFDFVDFSQLPLPETDAVVSRLADAEVQRPFDLTSGPLFRITLLRLKRETHVLLLTQHHIVSDGWSIGLLVKELVTLYEAFSSGSPSPLPPLDIQYSDFARWQRDPLRKTELDRQLAYWKNQLGDAPKVLQLPTDHQRPAIETFQGAIEPFALSSDLSCELQRFSDREGVTIFMTLLAALQTLLYRYSNQDDILIGAPIANRHRAETEPLIGFFINTLVLRGRLYGGDISFRELLSQIRRTCLEAYANQDVPFEKLVGELLLERELSHNPLVQVVLAFQNMPMPALEFSGVTLSPLPVTNRTSLFDLTLSLSTTSQGLGGYLQYSTSLFEAVSIKRLKSHFEILLKSILSSEADRVSDLPILTHAERHQLLAEWNSVAEDLLLPGLYELFERQVRERPDAIAVVDDRMALSYEVLRQRAEQIAFALQQAGVEPETIVGLHVERSVNLVIGVLAILKAGGAYLPLEPSFPAERIAFMLQDAGVSVVLTESNLEHEWPDNICTIALNVERPPARCPATPSNGSDHPAYVIYTSGSTGRAKGVLVTNHNVARLMSVTEERFRFDENDVWTLFHSFAFDFSVWELWGALLYGGKLVVVPYWISRSPELFYSLLVEEGVTVLNQTPSAFRQLIQAEESLSHGPGALSLRHVVFGGEALDRSMLRPWFERHGDVRPQLVNMYGITETTVHVTYRALKVEDSSEGASLIGAPIGDLQIHILSDQFHHVPIGVPGQLCVGGAGVARGYLERPELTAERFIPDPWSNSPGRRLYLSGDLGRYRHSGDIEYLGRMDHQVKIRGFRIELGEIEAVLSQHSGVKEVVVLARGEATGPQLVAYVVMESSDVTFSELRQHALERLPEYMVPATYVRIESIPLTANGKVDRRALPDVGQQRPTLAEEFEAPSTPAEQQLADVWSRALGLDRIGRNDNFFELGGDSILSIQVSARASRLGLKLTPKQLFQYPTISQLAALCGPSPEVLEDHSVAGGPVPLTPIQQWFFEGDVLNLHHWNQSLILEFAPSLNPRILLRAVKAVMAYHDSLSFTFRRQSDGWEQTQTSAAQESDQVHIDLATIPDARLASVIETVADSLQASLDLSAGPLWRAAMLNCGPLRQGRLLMIVHHLVVDGVSWRILLEDFQTAFQQLSAGEDVILPPKSASYRRWSQLLVDYASSDELRQDAAYWIKQGGSQVSRLPLDYSARDSNTVASIAAVSHTLGREETRVLLSEIPALAHAQINEILLTALARVLTRWAGAPVLIDLEGHGREELNGGIDLSRTVGWFTSLFPVRLDIDGAESPALALKTIKEQLRMVPRRGLSYGILRYLSPDQQIVQTLRAQAAAQLSFNYLGQFDQILDESTALRWSRESAGKSQSPSGLRRYEHEVAGSVLGGQLSVTWLYSRNLHRTETIEELVNHFLRELRTLIDHLKKPGLTTLSVSDFPHAKVNQADLHRLMAKLGKQRS